ncbi:receptor-like serine/threonine-protein kinase NCRK [Vicia villosa]|uniref:receptor-like serine/threonine-protein kinase NCRK n=1 Tax=Vicia villosa TaxID=3911 RepID=UPI00273AE162|nr:receptor-like serine/threonine-protein kinase NCRK [Vicia villosa]XP_058729776.1 receptor-like serine/threonine-protein kinase NCRK [Vicia villosa]XP_058729777.1 receptor-like serine/threonine-protein kinase NCRK [Vicia villosa]XP_058729778.1 receptor-like serine/threonine-protein kinase NCRK [Vicia villosa]XP_058729779.1 receptor-like serine/threonine-protein kinase NCRK [Vicia villosa]XP_058729780.1 receptor-like serine/threonine-protein kinase NCRK [Vicia villosa]XP_058729781.1 receptor
MKSQIKIALAIIISLLWIQHSFCDEASDTSSLNKWKCRCASFEGNQSNLLANCSKSCDCHSDSEEDASIWTCICGPNGFPQVAEDGHSAMCFHACNCTWGTVSTSLGSKKHISSKVVVIVLLICVICTTIALITTIVCYVYRRKQYSIQSPIFSVDKETSSGSTANLISHRTGTSSVPETTFFVNSPICHITGCFKKPSFLFGSQKETFHGNIIQFSYGELESATDNFSATNLIGLGGSSYVYRGRLRDGNIVAVKRLKDQGGPEADSAFFKEIELISRLHHCHLVPLLGYCLESKGKHMQRLLVFEYLINGSLRDWLDGVSGKYLDWTTRVTIAIGAARGLEYLHEAAAPRILHRDVKSTNILLDEKWQAKITDLGMAKNLRSDDLPSGSDSPARMQGTFGYFAPEYAIIGRASLESDVFSFGVVLLELISGRHPIHKTTGKEESLVIWASPRLQDSRRVISEIVDPQLKGNFPEEEVHIMAYLAKECLLLDPDTRPTMSEVVQILSSILPGKSRRRRNISTSLFQEPEDVETKRQAHSSEFPAHNSSPLDTDYNPSLGNKNREEDAVSAEYMESLILLASKSNSSHSSEEEMVDITEPRFESFCMTNGTVT